MAANVTFNINAVDKTRAAFAQVNQGLKNLINGGDATNKKLLAMGLQAVGLGSALAVLGTQIRKVATETENVPGIDQETIASWNRLKMGAEVAGGVLQNVVATAGRGISDLIGLLRFGAIAAVQGLDAAEKDLLETERLASLTSSQRTEQLDKEAAAMRKRAEAQKQFNLLRMRESEAQSVDRLRAEAQALETSAAATENKAKKNELLATALDLRSEAETKIITLEDKSYAALEKRLAGEEEVDKVFKNSFASLRELNVEREKLLKLLGQANMDLISGSTEGMEKTIKLNERLTEVDKERLDLMKRQRDIADQVGSSIASGFEEAIFSGGKLRDVLKGILQDIIRIIIRQTITTPLATAISGGITGFFGGATSTATPVPAKAMGGPVSGGATYLVGERGPELFTPSTAGRIIPNHDMQNVAGGGSGQSFTFVYNVAAGVTKMELLGALKASEQSTITKIRSQRVRSAQPFAMA